MNLDSLSLILPDKYNFGEWMDNNNNLDSVYWQAQMEAIQALRLIGLVYRLNERIEPMKVYKATNRFWRGKPTDFETIEKVKHAEKSVAHIVFLRTQGFEPDVKDGKYVS